MIQKDTYSPSHLQIKRQLFQISNQVHTLNDFAREAKRNNLAFEDIELANGRELLFFTGSSGYDIVGFDVRCRNNQIRIGEIRRN